MFTFINKPNDIIVDTKTEPPYESKGRGTPTIGINPVTIAVLETIYKKILVPTPKAINLPNFDTDLKEI